MKQAAILLLLGGCAAPPPAPLPRTPVEWTMAQRPTEGFASGSARLGAGRWVVLEPRTPAPACLLWVQEDRRRAPVGEVIRVSVGIDSRAAPGEYRVRAVTAARFDGPSELSLRPGGEGAFRVMSDRPGSAQVRVELMEVVRHDVRNAAPRPE